MAKNLWALEEENLGVGESELETSPEEGEVADVQLDTDADTDDMGEVGEAVDNGLEATSELEEVQEVVEQAAENGEGLDPVAAEAIRIAVKAIASKVGANPKSVYSLYSMENFQSASSRKANTKYALEGIAEFLKDLWSKIKAAVSKLWAKVTAFWDKHISSLGRSLKALESMKTKISQVKGTPGYAQIAVPSSLASIFPVKANLDPDEIKKFATRLSTARNAISDFRILEQVSAATKLTDVGTAVSNYASNTGKAISFGDEGEPMPGGTYFKWTIKLETEQDDGVKITTLDIDEDHGDYTEGRKEAQMDFASKDKLKQLIVDTITTIKELVKYRDRVSQRAKAIDNNMKQIDKEINGNTVTEDKKKEHKSNMRNYNLIMSKAPMMEAKLLSLHLTYVRGVLAYSNTCLKNFK